VLLCVVRVVSLKHFTVIMSLLFQLKHYIEKNPRSGLHRFKFLHDNAPLHRSVLVETLLEKQRIEALLHLAYSPDLFPCYFWLNLYIKFCLHGRWVENKVPKEVLSTSV
jgi:hypothetical protein